MDKFHVLCINAIDAPQKWPFEGGWIESVTSIKYLGVIFEGGLKKWHAHFHEKMAVARFVAFGLRAAGLLGGRNPPAVSLQIVRSMVWATLDHGRAAASSQGPGHEPIAKKLETFQMSLLREVLGLSASARKDGVLGETGELPDVWRERKKQLLVAFQMIHAPEGSLPARIAKAAISACPRRGLFATVELWLANLDTKGRTILDFKSKGDIKQWIWTQASDEWKHRVKESTSLRGTYNCNDTLRCRGYLAEDFKGRQLLTKLRVDDLDLDAAGYKRAAAEKVNKQSGTTTLLSTCRLCGVAPETRHHFVVQCRALDETRARHPGAQRLVVDLSPQVAFCTIILARPHKADDDITTARLVGALLHDLWITRANLLGIHTQLN